MKKRIKNVSLISLGALFLAVGISVFLTPNKVSSGGISSIGTVLLHLFDINMSITNLFFNLLLFGLGFKLLGKGAILKTSLGIVMLSVFLELCTLIPSYKENVWLASIAGGVLVGLGVGLVVRAGASTGGSDFAALMIRRTLPYLSVATIILLLDCLVILISGIIFKSVTVTIYSLISMYISSRVTDAIITLGSSAKAVRIFSKGYEEIASLVMKELSRGVTGIHSRGMYSRKEQMMLFCVVSPKELPRLVSLVRQVDSGAFVIINDAKEVLGEGFKESSDYENI